MGLEVYCNPGLLRIGLSVQLTFKAKKSTILVGSFEDN